MPISGDQQDLGDVAWWSTAIVGSAADAILSFGVDGVITSWNPAAERLYGYRAGEAVGRHISMVFPPSLPAKPHDILVAVRAGSYVGNFETQVTHKEGFDVAVAVTLRPLFDPDGRLIGASAVSHQLWDATPAARAREEAEGHFQAAFRRSDFGIVLSAIGGEATAVNPATCDLLGRPAEELIGNNWSRFTHPEDLHVAELAMAGFSEGRDSVSFECRFALPDGRFVWLMINTTLVRDRADRPSFLMTQLHDITDRKKAESELEYRALHDHLTGLQVAAALGEPRDRTPQPPR